MAFTLALACHAGADDRTFVFSVIPDRASEKRAFVFSESTVHYRSAGRVEANLVGGPVILLRDTRRVSDAVRALGNDSSQNRGYTVRASLSFQF